MTKYILCKMIAIDGSSQYRIFDNSYYIMLYDNCTSSFASISDILNITHSVPIPHKRVDMNEYIKSVLLKFNNIFEIIESLPEEFV